MLNNDSHKKKETYKNQYTEGESCFLLLWDGPNKAIDVVMALYQNGWSYENSVRIMKMADKQNAIIRYGTFHDLNLLRHELSKFQLKTTIVRISSYLN